MGSVLSLIQDACFTIHTLFKAISSLNEQYQDLLRRIVNPPPSPSANPTKPYWHHDPPFPELVDIQSQLPAEADVVIIGSGITGAAAARALVELASTPLRIVVLEARQLCSGATGRNGGHIKCTPYELFALLRKTIGERKAAEVVRFQMRHLSILKEVGEQVPEGQVREVETVDLFVDEEEFEEARANVNAVKEWLPEFECGVWTAEEAREKFGASHFVIGATSYQAGALWPYRLVTSIWNSLLKEHPGEVIISTHTVVEAVTVESSSIPYIHRVKTSKGTMSARHVLHATNAYAPYLVPSVLGCLSGFRGHMTAQRPGNSFPVQTPHRSWSVIHKPDYEYITQLLPDQKKQEKHGLLMVGGAFMRSQKQGPDQWGTWDDSVMEALTAMTVAGSMPTAFEDWGDGGGVVSAWSGIIGMTGDMMPFVGRIHDDKGAKTHGTRDKHTAPPGQWISAGYSGEGMVSAWLAATAVAIMILGLDDVDLTKRNGIPAGKLESWFPKQSFGMDRRRMRRANLKNLAAVFNVDQ